MCEQLKGLVGARGVAVAKRLLHTMFTWEKGIGLSSTPLLASKQFWIYPI